MKVSVWQENLSKGLEMVARAASKRSTLPVLEHILLSTDGGRLRLSASNLELGMHVWIGAEVKEEGAVTIPAKTIVDLVKQFPNEQVDITADLERSTLALVCGGHVAHVKGLPADQFVDIPLPTKAVPLDAAGLKDAIKRAAISAASDDSRPTLTGCLLQVEGDTMTLAAADGFRLSVCTVPLQAAVEPMSVIVPARTLRELARLDLAGVRVQLEDNRITFDLGGDVVLVSQLIDGKYPDFNQIVPESRQTRVTVGADDLLQALKGVNVFAREAAQIVKFSITENTLTVSAVSAEMGDGTATLAVEVEGEPIDIGFNIQYLMEGLEVAGGGNVTLDFTTSSSPLLMTPEGEGFRYVVMPMHIGR